MLNLPNFLTLIRILTIPFFLIALAYQRYWEALLIFAFGGFTDFLDGLAARYMRQETRLGRYLDPMADKLLVFSSYVMLGLIYALPPWLVVIVVMRDVFILLGFVTIYYLTEQRLEARPSAVGKASTAFQLLTLGVALAALHEPALIPTIAYTVLIWITAATTMLSGLQYLYRGLLWLQNQPPNPP
jgi:cardiolipin synthase